jgi:hypothetical protein
VHDSGYERIASPVCSDRTIRRRLRAWAELGLAQTLHALVLGHSDRLIGLGLAELAVDGCITKAPCGGETAGRSPVDPGKQGLKRSTRTDANGIPLRMVSTGAHRRDAPLLGPMPAGLDACGSLDPTGAVPLDRGRPAPGGSKQRLPYAAGCLRPSPAPIRQSPGGEQGWGRLRAWARIVVGVRSFTPMPIAR